MTRDEAIIAMKEREAILEEKDPVEFEIYKAEKADFTRRLTKYKEEKPELYARIIRGESPLFLWFMENYYPEFLELNKFLKSEEKNQKV